MPNSPDLPLHIFQVLEEEYISLYGQLEQETQVSLRGRQVTSALNWDFHKGHIKKWENLKRYLEEPDSDIPSKLKGYFEEEGVSGGATD